MSDLSTAQPVARVRKLEIGSGNRPTPGFEHLDFDPNLPDLQYCADFRNLGFIEDKAFDEILSVDSIQHIPWPEIRATVKEWVRVLKPGGIIRISAPSLDSICGAFMRDDDSWKKDYKTMSAEEQVRLQIDGVPDKTLWANFRLFSSTAGFDNHYACLTGPQLRDYLEEAGCSKVYVTPNGEMSFLINAVKQ